MSVASLRKRVGRVEEDLPQLLEPGLDRETAQRISQALDAAVLARERIEQGSYTLQDPFRGVEQKWDAPRFNSGGFETDLVSLRIFSIKDHVFLDRYAKKRGIDLKALLQFAVPLADLAIIGYGWRTACWLGKWNTTPEPVDHMLPPHTVWQWYCLAEHHLAAKENPNYDREALSKELDGEKAGFFAEAEAVGWTEKRAD